MAEKQTDFQRRSELFDLMFWNDAPATALLYRSGAYSHFDSIDTIRAEDRPARRVNLHSAAEIVGAIAALSRAIQAAKFEPMPKDEDEARKAKAKARAKAQSGGKVVWLFDK